jgi:hypothetical protein
MHMGFPVAGRSMPAGKEAYKRVPPPDSNPRHQKDLAALVHSDAASFLALAGAVASVQPPGASHLALDLPAAGQRTKKRAGLFRWRNCRGEREQPLKNNWHRQFRRLCIGVGRLSMVPEIAHFALMVVLAVAII